MHQILFPLGPAPDPASARRAYSAGLLVRRRVGGERREGGVKRGEKLEFHHLLLSNLTTEQQVLFLLVTCTS